MALYSLSGWVRKNGHDSSSDSKWFTTRAIRQKYKAHVCVFGKYLYVSELKGVNGFLHERKKEGGRDGER